MLTFNEWNLKYFPYDFLSFSNIAFHCHQPSVIIFPFSFIVDPSCNWQTISRIKTFPNQMLNGNNSPLFVIWRISDWFNTRISPLLFLRVIIHPHSPSLSLSLTHKHTHTQTHTHTHTTFNIFVQCTRYRLDISQSLEYYYFISLLLTLVASML